MRPKKRVLIVDANEERLSVLRFTLGTMYGRTVKGAATAEEAYALAAGWLPDLLVTAWPSPPIDVPKLLIRAHRTWPSLPLLLMANAHAPEALQTLVDGIAMPAERMAGLIARVKLMTAHKRGPKPKPVQSVPVPIAAQRRLA